MGFVFARVFEALVESGPQTLLQLFVALKRGNDTSRALDSTDVLLFGSIGCSILSVALGLANFERTTAFRGMLEGYPTNQLFIPTWSRYYAALVLYRLSEITARMCLLACFGAAVGGWGIGAVLGFDWVAMILLPVKLFHKNTLALILKHCATLGFS